jgi:hypothetical protein
MTNVDYFDSATDVFIAAASCVAGFSIVVVINSARHHHTRLLAADQSAGFSSYATTPPDQFSPACLGGRPGAADLNFAMVAINVDYPQTAKFIFIFIFNLFTDREIIL